MKGERRERRALLPSIKDRGWGEEGGKKKKKGRRKERRIQDRTIHPPFRGIE